MTNKLFLFRVLENDLITVADTSNFWGISTSLDWIPKNGSSAHKHGLYVMVWSPDNDAQNKDALNKKADIIKTDDPISLLKLLERYNYDYTLP